MIHLITLFIIYNMKIYTNMYLEWFMFTTRDSRGLYFIYELASIVKQYLGHFRR